MASNLRVDTILPSSGTNVAIGTASGTVSLIGDSNLTTSGNLTIGGNLGVGGTLTYEDVTNIDSVGVITARSGIRIGATGANSLIAGNATGISLGTGTARQKLHINASDSGAANMVFTNATTGTAAGDGFVIGITGGEDAQLNMQESANIKFSTADTERLRILNNGHVAIGDDIANDTGMFKVIAADGQSDDQYVGQFKNLEATANRNWGLLVQAGSSSTDESLRVRNGANNADHLKIRGDGVVTTPQQPAFRAGCSSDLNPGGNGTIIFQDVTTTGSHFNVGGYYSTTTGAFTAPVAGIYNFYTQILWESMNDGEDMHDAILIMYNPSGGGTGGSLVSYDARRAEYVAGTTGNGGYYGAFTTVMVNMAAGGSCYVRNKVNLTVHGNRNFTFFQGYLIG